MTQTELKPKIRNGRILVVDDDQAMCQLLYDLLRDEGYEVDLAYDAGSALEKYRMAPFDLTITDLMMPKMKGVELISRLRQINTSALVLLITGFGSIESAVEAMRAGAFHYVTKPFHNDEILIQVKRALEQKSLREEVQRLRDAVDVIQALTDWMGDDGRLTKISTQYRKFNYMGDVTWAEGEVTDKFERGGKGYVRCNLWTRNHRDEITAKGVAEAELARRSG